MTRVSVVHSSLHTTYNSIDRRFSQINSVDLIEKKSSKLKPRKTVYNVHTHTHPFNGSFSGTTLVSRYQKGKTNLDLTEARDSEWQWHQLGHMQVCTSLQADNHASTPPLKWGAVQCNRL